MADRPNTAASDPLQPHISQAPAFRREVESRVTAVEPLSAALASWAAAQGVSPGVLRSVALMLDELFTNVVMHGYRHDPQGRIVIEARVQAGKLVVTLTDAAPPFNPLLVPEPNTASPLAERQIGGLGLMFVRRTADCLSYRLVHGPDGDAHNQVSFGKHLLKAPRKSSRKKVARTAVPPPC